MSGVMELLSTDKTVLYEGHYSHVKNCLESAISQHIDLTGIDLRYQNLSFANLDGGYMPKADLTGANLMGTNLSEAYLPNSNFTQADLYNCCLCESDLRHCLFHYSGFGGTDFFQATLSGSLFSGRSYIYAELYQAKAMDNCSFQFRDITYKTSCPPQVILGNHEPEIFFHTIAQRGSLLHNH